MSEFKMALSAPVLNGKVLDVNVARAFGGLHGIDHADGRDVILKK